MSRRATTPEVISFPLMIVTEAFPGCAPRITVCGWVGSDAMCRGAVRVGRQRHEVAAHATRNAEDAVAQFSIVLACQVERIPAVSARVARPFTVISNSDDACGAHRSRFGGDS